MRTDIKYLLDYLCTQSDDRYLRLFYLFGTIDLDYKLFIDLKQLQMLYDPYPDISYITRVEVNCL